MRRDSDSSSAMAWAIGQFPLRPALTLLALPRGFHLSPVAIAKHQTLRSHSSIFVHARDTVNRQALIPGSKVSFFYEADEKGGKAKDVAVEEMAEAVELDEAPREMGTVKVRFTASSNLLGHFVAFYYHDAVERRELTKLKSTALECRQRLRIHLAREWRGRVSLPASISFYRLSLLSWRLASRG